MKKIVQVYPWINKDEKNEILKVINSTFLTEGKKTLLFEKKISKFCKSKFSISFNNWTSGLFAALKVIGVKHGDEVIVPDLTFIATSNSVYLSGAKIILAPVSNDNFCLDLDKLESLINKKTKAIIPVHLYGQCCDMNKLKKILKKFKKKIYIIEDAAQAIGSKYRGKSLGLLGDLGGFSFYGNKIITTGEGGAIITNNLKLKKKLYEFKNHGREKKGTFIHKSIGYNFMFTELQAALGISQINKLPKIIKRKKEINNMYKKGLKNISEIEFPKISQNCDPIHWFTNIKCKSKSKLQSYLGRKKIQTRDFFLPLHMQPCYKNNKKIIKKLSLSNSNKIYNNHLSLPSAYEISNNEIKYVIKSIKQFYK